MTNKKFKLAAMSMALTACVAAQPLVANAADDIDAAGAQDNAPAPQEISGTGVASAGTTEETKEDVRNNEPTDAVDVIDDDTTVDYDHDNDTTTKNDDGSTTTDSTGTVNKNETSSDPKEETPEEDGEKTPETSEESGSSEDEQQPEKTPIGTAEKSETETKETETVLDPDTTRPSGKPSTSVENPDGTTTITTPTITEGTETTTTTVKGEAKADTEETTSTPSEKIDLDKELGGTKPKWDTETGTTFGGSDEAEDEKYKVTDVKTSKDGKSQTLTMVKEKTEDGSMTGEDIAKLIEAGYQKNDDGTYTLTKEYTDSDGKTWTETVTVDESTATKKTTTTLTLTLKKTEHNDSTSVDETTDTGGKDLGTRYPDKTTIKDENGTLWSGSVADLLEKAKGKNEFSYTENGKTYTFKFSESSSTDEKFNFSAEDAARLLGDGYTYNKEDGKIYHVDGDKLAEVDYAQAIKQINLHIELTVSEEKKEDHESVNKKDGQTIEDATAAAEKKAAEDALKDALKKAAREAGIDVSDDTLNAALAAGKISISNAGSWTYKTTVDGVEKTFVFHYDKPTASTAKADASEAEKEDAKKDNGEEIGDINKNTSTGSAGVTGVTITWKETGKETTEVIKSDETSEGIDLVIPEGVTGEAIEGGTRYTYEKDGKNYELIYSTPTADQLAEIERTLLASGATSEDIQKRIENGEFTYVTWKITHPTTKEEEVIETVSSDKTSLSSGNVQIDQVGKSYTITVNGKTYKNMTTSDGGKTYTSIDGKNTTKIIVTKTNLDNDEIEALLKESYGNTVKVDANGKAAYTRIVDGKEVICTIDYSDAFKTTASVTVTTASPETATGHTEEEAYAKLVDQINKLKKEAEARGEHLYWNETDLSETEITIDVVKKIVTAVNFGSLKGDDLVNFLQAQKKAAEASGDSYNGNSYWDKWNDGQDGPTLSETNKNTIGHLDLGVDSTLTTIDKLEEDCILVPKESLAKGDAKIEFVWNQNADDLVNNRNNQTVGLIERVTLDDEDGRGDGHYEFPRASWDNNTGRGYWDDKGNWIPHYVNPTPDNTPKTSSYYRVTGTVAYGSLKDNDGQMQSFNSKNAAREAAEAYAKAKGIDTSNITVVAVYPDQDKNSTPVYRAYLYKSNLTAYGYMTKESNTCINSSFKYTYKNGRPSGLSYIGGYDLLLSKLTQVSEDQITGEQYKSYSFVANLFTKKEDSGSRNDLTQNALRYTHTVPDEDETVGQGTGYFGKYDIAYTQERGWSDSGSDTGATHGTGNSWFYSFKKLFTDTRNGSEDVTRKEGTINADYATASDATIVKEGENAPTMETVVKTSSKVNYHFTHTETKNIFEEGSQTIVITPEEDGDEDPVPPTTPELPPVQDATPDTPVEPEAPVLPPVQDATPDAPVLPTNAVLPAVQDARALPQTGVNWLAAIGLALSGFSLMVGGAWASLTGKNAKH